LGYDQDYESFLSFLKKIENKNPEELRNFFMEEYEAKKAIIDTLDISVAGKQYFSCATDLFFAFQVSKTTSWVDNAYLYINNLTENREAMMKYYETHKWNIPEDFYQVLQNLPLINDSKIVYIPEIYRYLSEWQAISFKPEFVRTLGTDQGILFDLLQTAQAYKQIMDFAPLNNKQIEELPVTFREYVQMKNEDLLKLIEANKQKTDFTVSDDIEKVSEKEVFPFILSKYRGKVILLDIWATWCGPCRLANKEMQPMKAELEGKDIVYVYVAGENSPLATWNNMIPDLHGEHFRLSEKQWDYVGKTFHIEGVPTYFFVDKKGNIRYKQTGYPGMSVVKEKLLQLLEE
jgi:thiol-disulfide isomerase/thioredoxin